MEILHRVNTGSTEAFAINRRLRDLRALAVRLSRSPMSPLQTCEAIVENRLVDPETRKFFSDLPPVERHYWISSLYALLMPKGRRKRLAAYFTPPHLSEYVLNAMDTVGINPLRHRILDPASGGAAFLVPLAARIRHELRAAGRSPQAILESVETHLAGVEIDANLASLSKLLIEDLLQNEIKAAKQRPRNFVLTADALKADLSQAPFDAIVGNPPYGRIFRPTKTILRQFESVISDGYVNKYALFIARAIEWVRPGGVICLVVPTSFLGGPSFRSLRQFLIKTTEIVQIDPVDKRSDVFLDVLYDVCILVLRKRGKNKSAVAETFSALISEEGVQALGKADIPGPRSERPWALPDGKLDDTLFCDDFVTLADYGYATKTGYFVWNREQHRYRTGKKPRRGEVPLYWAHDVKPNALSTPSDDDGDRIGFVRIKADSSAIVKTDAIILQRTSNRRQAHRLIASIIRKNKVPGKRGFVSENHTVLLLPQSAGRPKLPISLLCRLLNTRAVDDRFRRISGTVSISTKALRDLPLPTADSVRVAFSLNLTDDEAAEEAYRLSSKAATQYGLPAQNKDRGES